MQYTVCNLAGFRCLAEYSASSIIRPCWATFFQNLGRIRKVSIEVCPPSTTYTTLKRT